MHSGAQAQGGLTVTLNPPSREPCDAPAVFALFRLNDSSGVSGPGRVLDGVLFHTGQVVVCWRSDIRPDNPLHSSIGVYPSFEAFRQIHIDPHPDNRTQIVWGPHWQPACW